MDQDDGSDDGMDVGELESILFFEITVGAKDQPRLLSKLSKALVSTVCFKGVDALPQ